MNKPKVLLLEYDQRIIHYKPLMDRFDADYIISNELSEEVFEKTEIDLTICADEWVPETALNILASRKAGVPVLHIPDGMLEWRNTYEHPRAYSQSCGMPLHQPHLADKVACIGRNQARMMEAWGSAGKCEVIGCARFDPILTARPRQRREGEPFRILVTSARTPAFSIKQETLISRAIGDLAIWCEQANYQISNKQIELAGRLTDKYKVLLPQHESVLDFSEMSLYEALGQVDAVITTPSTLMLEAMLYRIPVVLLDYTNSPAFTPSIWNITAPRHIENVLPELLVPPACKMLHQDIILHDCLECCSPALDRLVDLVMSMIDIARECKSNGNKPSFPERMIPVSPHVGAVPEKLFNLEKLYPGHPVFSCRDSVELQMEIGQLRLLLESQASRIECQSNQIASAEAANRNLQATLSWRMTSPLRTLGETVCQWWRK